MLLSSANWPAPSVMANLGEDNFSSRICLGNPSLFCSDEAVKKFRSRLLALKVSSIVTEVRSCINLHTQRILFRESNEVPIIALQKSR
jgi:hypothetical protein